MIHQFIQQAYEDPFCPQIKATAIKLNQPQTSPIFHIDCKFTKKKICTCSNFCSIPFIQQQNQRALQVFLQHELDGVKLEDFKEAQLLVNQLPNYNSMISIRKKLKIHKKQKKPLDFIKKILNYQINYIEYQMIPKDQDKVLLEILKQNEMTEQKKKKFQNSIRSLVHFLKQLDYDPFNAEIKYCIFGSQLNGFGTKESDVDFTFLTNSYVDERIALKYLRQEIESVDQNKFKINELVEFARIAVMKIQDQTNEIEIDMCFNNLLGVINTKLLNAYAGLNEKVQQGGILLKLWGKKQGIINKNCFSSYAILIMWLHFLQQKYQMPNLQDKQHKTSKSQTTTVMIKRNIEGKRESSFQVDAFFVYNGDKSYKLLKDQFDKVISLVSLTILLRDFFNYYSDQGEGFTQKYKISINEKQLKEEGEKYSMSDPFDKEHDPIKKIRNNFKEQTIFHQAGINIQNSPQSMF